jgi:phage gp37-like protein
MQIGQVEDAIIAKVKAVFGNKLSAVDSVPAEVDEDMLKRLLRTTPAVYVVFDGGGDPSPGGSEAKLKAQFSCLVITSNAGGEKLRRRGDPQGQGRLGAYDICEILIPALHRMTVKDVGTLVFDRLENRNSALLDNMGCAAYAPVFELQINMPGFDYIAALAPFLTAKVTTELPDGGAGTDNVQVVSLPQ